MQSSKCKLNCTFIIWIRRANQVEREIAIIYAVEDTVIIIMRVLV